MWREKSPGVKILWLWTFGTAAVLVTSVVRMRIRDMEKFMNAEQGEAIQPDSTLIGDSPESIIAFKEKNYSSSHTGP